MSPPKKIKILSDVKTVSASKSTAPSSSSSSMPEIMVNDPNTSRAQASTITSSVSDPLTIIVDYREQEGSCLISPFDSTTDSCTFQLSEPKKTKVEGKVEKCEEESNTELKESTLEDFDQICDKFLSSHLANIVKIQARLHTRKARGRRYTAEYKSLL
ncbi:hypothetical protein JTB14_009361 [Gonioctena quinquepunctata]|nr:hypothetical protein JTB14_009361 [Gonioctena quinquepunctata]